MPIQGTNAKSQTDLVRDELSTQNNEIVERVKVPGIETLHERSTEEIAAVLANIIKSRAGITKLTYVKGSHLEITSNGNPLNQLRG